LPAKRKGRINRFLTFRKKLARSKGVVSSGERGHKVKERQKRGNQQAQGGNAFDSIRGTSLPSIKKKDAPPHKSDWTEVGKKPAQGSLNPPKKKKEY